MQAQKTNLAPNWWDEGRCLITGGITSTYLKNRQTMTKKTRLKISNWGKHEETH